MNTDQEIELKLEIDADAIDRLAASPPLAAIVSDAREQLSTYFDTPDQTLRRAGVSLRIRRSGERLVQTVKASGAAAAGLFARAEWEREVEGDLPEIGVAHPIRTLIAAEALAAVAPAFTVAVTRRRWDVTRGDTAVELVADTGEAIAGDRRTAVCEIELELKEGHAAELFALAHELGRAVPLRLGVVTKAERGYRLLAAATGAHKAESLALTPGMSTAAAFAAIVGTCLRQFRLNEEILRTQPTAEAIHQARVALRRMRSALSIFRPVVEDAHYPALASELRWLAGSLGDARDLDVLIERVPDAAERLSPVRDAAYAAALAALDSQRARDLMLQLVEWSAIGAWRTAPVDPVLTERPAERFAARALDRMRRRIKRRGRHLAKLDDEERHSVRIQAKRLRYATGFFAALFPGDKAARRHTAFQSALATLQDHLGDLNDLATAPALLARHGLPEERSPAARRATLLAKAADARGTLLDAKRFWS